MEPMTQLTYPIAPLPQLVFPYFHYHPISPPYEPLDLSKKRSPSLCYAYPYPSPNPSPTYMPVHSPSAEYMLSPKPSPNGLLITSPVSERRIPNSVVDLEPCERSSSSYSDSSTSPSSKVSGTRPFKAFPKDPLRLSLGVGAATSEPSNIILRETLSENGDSEMTKALIDDSVKAYSEFRQKMMEKISHENGTNTNMRRTQHQNDKICDEEYLRKRRKNNEAAKKSRDARRQKQDEIAIRVTFLEQENMMLRYKVAAAEAELEQLEKLKLPM